MTSPAQRKEARRSFSSSPPDLEPLGLEEQSASPPSGPPTMVPFKISGEGSTVTVDQSGRIVRVHGKGKEEVLGTVDASGELRLEGKVVARILADGTIELAPGKESAKPMRMSGKLDAQGVLTSRESGKTVKTAFGVDGVLVVDGRAMPVRVTPANNPTVNRLAIMLFFLTMVGA